MKRIYAIQQNRDYTETEFYFDFEIESKELKFAILGGRDFASFKFREYERIEKYFDDFIFEYENIKAKYIKYYNNITELVNDLFYRENGKKYNTKEIHAFKNIFERYKNDKNFSEDDAILCILELMTGEKYKTTAIRGCCQGDYAEIIHPVTIEKETIDYIEACYFGTGTEYSIYEEETEEILSVEELENNCDYIGLDYTALWSATLYKQELSKRYNLPLENIVVYEITNTKRRTIIENEYAIA